MVAVLLGVAIAGAVMPQEIPDVVQAIRVGPGEADLVLVDEFRR